MLTVLKSYRLPIGLALLCVLLYWSFGYDTVRSDFIKLISLVGTLFFITYRLIKMYGWNFWLLTGIGIAVRLVFLPTIPNLSQDFYRFLWDGQLVSQWLNPYLFTPEMFVGDPSQFQNITIHNSDVLVRGMGALNAGHFSNYPPVNQLCFAISALVGGKSILGSVITLRLLIIGADIGILYFGKKLLDQFKLPAHLIFWFFLNPFIIIELTGNLHFEGVMLFFLVWSFYLLQKGKWFPAALILGLSISVKLIPLIFLPLFYHYFVDNGLFSKGFWKLKYFLWTVIIAVLLCFLPFYSTEFLLNFSQTISLWFQDFEFNASIFYIIRWLGFLINGWDPIETVGKIIPLFVLAFVLLLSFYRKNKTMPQLLTAMLFAMSFYLLLSTTVHPWYIATPLLLSIFTKYRFPIVWSGAVMLSYSAYGADGFSENLWLISLEYLIVIAYACWEIIFKKELKPGF